MISEDPKSLQAVTISKSLYAFLNSYLICFTLILECLQAMFKTAPFLDLNLHKIVERIACGSEFDTRVDFLKLYFHPSIYLFFIKSFLFYYYYFFPAPHSMWNLSSPTRKQAPCSGSAGPPEKSHGQILHRICLYNVKPMYLAIDNYVMLSQNIDYCSNSVLM